MKNQNLLIGLSLLGLLGFHEAAADVVSGTNVKIDANLTNAITSVANLTSGVYLLHGSKTVVGTDIRGWVYQNSPDNVQFAVNKTGKDVKQESVPSDNRYIWVVGKTKDGHWYMYNYGAKNFVGAPFGKDLYDTSIVGKQDNPIGTFLFRNYSDVNSGILAQWAQGVTKGTAGTAGPLGIITCNNSNLGFWVSAAEPEKPNGASLLFQFVKVNTIDNKKIVDGNITCRSENAGMLSFDVASFALSSDNGSTVDASTISLPALPMFSNATLVSTPVVTNSKFDVIANYRSNLPMKISDGDCKYSYQLTFNGSNHLVYDSNKTTYLTTQEMGTDDKWRYLWNLSGDPLNGYKLSCNDGKKNAYIGADSIWESGSTSAYLMDENANTDINGQSHPNGKTSFVVMPNKTTLNGLASYTLSLYNSVSQSLGVYGGSNNLGTKQDRASVNASASAMQATEYLQTTLTPTKVGYVGCVYSSSTSVSLPSDVTAYICVSTNNNELTMRNIGNGVTLPAGMAVIVKKESSETITASTPAITLELVSNGAPTVTNKDNLLKIVENSITPQSPTVKTFVMNFENSTPSNGLRFLPSSVGTLPNNQAYIEMPAETTSAELVTNLNVSYDASNEIDPTIANVTAQSYKYMTFQKIDRSYSSFPLTDLKIIFNGDKDVDVVSKENTTNFQTQDLIKMFFSVEKLVTTNIEAAMDFTDNTRSAENIAKLPIGTPITIYTTAGQVVRSTTLQKTGINLNGLVRGNYIIKINKTAYKIFKR